MRLKYGLFLFVVLLALSGTVSGQTGQPPLLKQIGQEMISGVLKANYREMPIDEILPVEELPLPCVRIASVGTHPRLLFPAVRSGEIRLRQRRAPYREWAENILNAASASPDPASPLLTEVRRSQLAESNAFAWFLTSDPDYLETALLALRNISDPDPVRDLEGGRAGTGWGDFLAAADALRWYAVAYDLIYSELSDADRRQVVSRLASQTEQLVRYRALVPKNNHAVVVGAGIGAAALALDHPRAQAWLNSALEEIRAGLAKIEPDGSYREGGYYARFVASRLYPFALYLDNVAGVNLLVVPRIRLFSRWLADIEMPDGSVPDFDDAFPEAWLYQPIAAGLAPEAQDIQTLFEKHPDRFTANDPNWIESCCAYVERPVLTTPDFETATFYPYGGMSIFRNGSEIYGLLLGEPGRPHLSGHDHVEPGAFTLFAFGQNLLIDAGYGPEGVNDPNRAWYISTEAHNIPLVDGLGPDQNPVLGDDLGGQTTDYFSAPSISGATVAAHYRDAEIERRVWFAGRRIFVVSDRLESGSPQHFAVPWHGAGTFEDEGLNHVRWTRQDVALDAHFIQPDDAPLFIESRAGLNTHPSSGLDHAIAHVSLPPSESQRLVTLFVPQRMPDRSATVAEIPVQSDAPASARLIRFGNSSEEILIVTATGGWSCGGLESDAELAIYQRSGFPEYDVVNLENATRLRMGGESVFFSTLPVTLTLVLDPTGWYGYLSPPDGVETHITFQTLRDPGAILLDKKSIEYRWKDDRITFTVQHSGVFEMGPQAGRVRQAETVLENLPILERLSHSTNPNAAQALTETEQIQLRNEIVAAMGQAGIETFDSRTGGIGAAGLFGLASGFMNSLFGQTGQPGLNLPQQFDLARDVSGHRVRYFEEGALSSDGLKTRRHQVFVDESLWLVRETPFSDYSSTSADFFQEDFQGQFGFQQFRQDRGWNVLLRRDRADGRVSAGHRSTLAGSDQTTEFGLASGDWKGDLALDYSRRGFSGLDFSGRHQTAGQGSTIRLATGQEAFREVDFGHSRRLSPHWFASGFLQNQRDSSNAWDSFFHSEAWFDYGWTSGMIEAFHTDQDEFHANWQGRVQRGRWRFDSRGQFFPLFAGDVGATWRTPDVSWQTRFFRGKILEEDLIFHPAPGWSSSVRAGWMIRSFSAREIGMGLWRRGAMQAGGEIRVIHEEGGWNTGLTGTADFAISGSERLSAYGTVYFDLEWRIKTLEILLRQSGGATTPGLLLLIDDRELVRLEGYLMWEF